MILFHEKFTRLLKPSRQLGLTPTLIMWQRMLQEEMLGSNMKY